jgi:transcription initiation factor TFIIB
MGQAARFRDGRNGKMYSQGETVKFLQELNGIAAKLNLPGEVSERAGSICTDAAAMRLCKVTSHPVLAAAALYVACREYRNPVTLRDLADASGSDPRDVGRCYATILERMHISRPKLNGGRYLYHLTLKQPLPENAYTLSEAIIMRATLGGLGGRNPMTLAAAALYLACCTIGEKMTQAELAEAAGVGEESVRECCKAIRTVAKPLTV